MGVALPRIVRPASGNRQRRVGSRRGDRDQALMESNVRLARREAQGVPAVVENPARFGEQVD